VPPHAVIRALTAPGAALAQTTVRWIRVALHNCLIFEPKFSAKAPEVV